MKRKLDNKPNENKKRCIIYDNEIKLKVKKIELNTTSNLLYYKNIFNNFLIFKEEIINDVYELINIFESPKIFGHQTPRKIAWFTKKNIKIDYKFSGKIFKSNEMPNNILKLCEYVSKISNKKFNSVLINIYEGKKIFDNNGKWIRGAGKESISWHQDDEKLFGSDPVIASVSIGQEREFRLRELKTKKLFKKKLENGSLLIMNSNVNKEFEHSIQKDLKLENAVDRINFTFRLINKIN